MCAFIQCLDRFSPDDNDDDWWLGWLGSSPLSDVLRDLLWHPPPRQPATPTGGTCWSTPGNIMMMMMMMVVMIMMMMVMIIFLGWDFFLVTIMMRVTIKTGDNINWGVRLRIDCHDNTVDSSWEEIQRSDYIESNATKCSEKKVNYAREWPRNRTWQKSWNVSLLIFVFLTSSLSQNCLCPHICNFSKTHSLPIFEGLDHFLSFLHVNTPSPPSANKLWNKEVSK